MGGLLSGLFSSGTIGGSSAKTDRGNFLTGIHDLNNIFSWGLPAGQQAFAKGQASVATGTGDLGTSADYLKKLTSGDRATTAQAIAPEVASVTSANDAAKRQLAATGTARGGGATAVNQTRDADAQAKIDQALFGVRPQAAGELAKVGSAEGELGLGETGAGLKAADLAAKSAGDIADLSAKSRVDSQKIHQQAVDDITKGIDQTLSAVMGAL